MSTKKVNGIEAVLASLKDNPLAQEIWAETDRARLLEHFNRIELLHKGQRQIIRQLEAILWYKEKQLFDEYNLIAKDKGLKKLTQGDVAKKYGLKRERITQVFGSIADTQALKNVLAGKTTLSNKPAKDGLEGRPGPKRGTSPKTPLEKGVEHVDKLGALILSEKTEAHHKQEIKAYLKQELSWVLNTGDTAESETVQSEAEKVSEAVETVNA